jgi:hypothetical protein
MQPNVAGYAFGSGQQPTGLGAGRRRVGRFIAERTGGLAVELDEAVAVEGSWSVSWVIGIAENKLLRQFL